MHCTTVIWLRCYFDLSFYYVLFSVLQHQLKMKSITEPVVASNKIRFLQHQEVITRRETNLKAFYYGLNVLQVGDLIKAHPERTRSLFVAGPDCLSSARFLSLILSTRPEQVVINQGRAFDYFRKFVLH